jgi:hypothetical protein
MDDTSCCRFFLEPTQTLHRRYEVLRAFFVQGRSQADIATDFGLTPATVQSLVRDFRAQVAVGQVPPFFASQRSAGHQAARQPLPPRRPPQRSRTAARYGLLQDDVSAPG